MIYMNKIYIFLHFVFLVLFSVDINAECFLEDKITGKNFRIFNAFLYKDMPDLSDLCIEPINVMYAWEFFPRGAQKGNLSLPTKSQYMKAITKIKEKNKITVIDIEHWPLKNASERVISRSVENYLDLISIIKNETPNIIIGYYGVVPTIDFSRSKNYLGGKRFNEWVEENNRVEKIANVVDAVFPSLYTINSNRQSWIGRAKSHIAESIRLAPSKPIYPFIWPNYHEQGGKYPIGYEVDSEYWVLQLEYLRDNADGIVLWGGNNITWNKNMKWWKELVRFVKSSFIIKNR